MAKKNISGIYPSFKGTEHQKNKNLVGFVFDLKSKSKVTAKFQPYYANF